jgi:glucokinase
MLDGWRDVPLAAEIRRATGLPCVIENDVNAAAVHECALRGHHGSMLFVAVGTGIGGALTVDGRVWRGASGVAGEIGNMVIERDGALCWCGRRGCLNTVASGSAIENAAGIAPGTLAERWQAGDPAALRAVDEGARALAVALGNAVNLLNPSVIVLGGGVAQLGARWLATVERHLHDEAFREATVGCRVELARAGYQAGAVGAARLANEAVENKALSR